MHRSRPAPRSTAKKAPQHHPRRHIATAPRRVVASRPAARKATEAAAAPTATKVFTSKDLELASREGDVLTLRDVLLQKEPKIDLDQPLTYGQTALITSVRHRHLKTIELLLTHGANINFVDKHHKSAIFYAIERNSYSTFNLLMKYGPDLTLLLPGNRTLLSHAAEHNAQPRIINALINHGFQVNHRNVDGSTPFMLAAQSMSVEQACFWLNHGADPFCRDKKGRSALDYARTNKDANVVRTLVSHAANLIDGNHVVQEVVQNKHKLSYRPSLADKIKAGVTSDKIFKDERAADKMNQLKEKVMKTKLDDLLPKDVQKVTGVKQ